MLQRIVTRSIVNNAYATPLTACAVCTCRCGTSFRRPNIQPHQRRTAYARKAPATRDKRWKEKGRVLSPAEARARREEEDEDRGRFKKVMHYLLIHGNVTITPEHAQDFVEAFTVLANQARGKNVVDVEMFKKLVEDMAISPGDMHHLNSTLMKTGREDDKFKGKKLLFTRSASGDEEATIRILNHASLDEKHKPGTLRSSEVLYARGHLREIARRGENYRAMVLEGKIAHQLGDHEHAIDMWNQAMGACVAAVEEEAEMKRRGDVSGLKSLRRRQDQDLDDLSSPWVELTRIHIDRYLHHNRRNEINAAVAELEKARKANDVGCAQDDPTSHYEAAEHFNTHRNADGTNAYTSTWLYHMSKAAASGYAKAAHRVGEFYAETGWKYIEDEPPDDLKPTPFDRYPAPSSVLNTIKRSTWTLRSLIGLDPSPTANPKASIFHTASFPTDPSSRQILAIRWLEISQSAMYAPSYLTAAKMLMVDTLWARAQTPAAALNLTDDRYSYASKEDYEAGNRTGAFDLDTYADDLPSLPNPGYNPTKAKEMLTQVFYALTAHAFHVKITAESRRMVRRLHLGFDAEDASSREEVIGRIPNYIKKFLRFQEVRELWENEVPQLRKEAEDMCEEYEWDIYNEEGGLVYKYGLRGGGSEKLVARA